MTNLVTYSPPFPKQSVCVFLCGVLLSLSVSALPEQTAGEVIREGGIVQSMSALLWLVVALLVLVNGQTAKHLTLSSLPLFCGMRELDLHREWTTDSVLKSKYWLTDMAATNEKIMAGVVLIIFLILMLSALKFYMADFLIALRAREEFAVSIFFSLILLFISKIFLDGFTRKMAAFGIEINPPIHVVIAEEVMELTAAALVMNAFIARLRDKKKVVLVK